jgi:hypothetical protein
MKIYKHGLQEQGLHNVFIQPGVDFPENSEWYEADGRPKLFTVTFQNGVATVPKNLGRYMVDKGLASGSEIIPGVIL